MTGDAPFSPADQELPPTPNIQITIEEGSHNSDQLLDEDSNELVIENNDLGIEENDLELEGNDANLEGNELVLHSNDLESDCHRLLDMDGNDSGNDGGDTVIADGENGEVQDKKCPPPIVGMEFDSYDDAYNYYNCYAGELGFAIRVKSSWTKRNSKEKRGAVLCCNCEGFKTVKEANTRRKETRTGCLAMIRLRLVESNKWRVDEVKLEHNHSFDPERAQNSKSHKKMDASAKRKMEPAVDIEVRTIKLYRTPIVDQAGHGTPNFGEDASTHADSSRRLKLRTGDAQVIHDYFARVQLTSPNFLYLMDLNDDGCLRNVFWMESHSRAAYSYFSDVVAFDTTYLSDEYEIPLVAFLGLNHHGKSVLLGCGLLADQTLETYVWLFRAWLTCIAGRPPQTIITDQCKTMQSAIAEVFPRARHHLHLPSVMQSILHDVIGLQDTESFPMALNGVVYGCLKVEEFEAAWEDMLLRFGLTNHVTLQALYDDRERWVPVYLKGKLCAGILTSQEGQCMTHFFDCFVNKNTSLKEFFDVYELVLANKHKEEALDDLESRHSPPELKTRYPYELQLSKLYTNEIFRRFQEEVVMMTSCFSIAQVRMNGPVTTCVVKEREGEMSMNRGEARCFEVMFDKSGTEVRCICGCFNIKGYLCRHALCILNYNGIEEIPFQYILSRWRKDLKRLYLPDFGSNNIDVTNPVQWFDHLYKKAMHVVEEGMKSQDHYTVAWQAFKESLSKVRLVAEKRL